MHQHIPGFIQALEPVIQRYGYLAVIGLLILEDFGIPAPGETVLIAAAFYAGLGKLSLPMVILVGILGAVIGDNIGFAIGHFGGYPLILSLGKYVGLTHERLAKTTKFFNRQGGKIIVVARFIEGLRQLNGIIAGSSEMHWATFLLFNFIGATLWVSTWALIGYFGGSHIDTFLRFQAYISVAALLAIAGYAGYKVYSKYKKPVKR